MSTNTPTTDRGSAPHVDVSDETWRMLREVAVHANVASATFDQLAEEVMELHLSLRGKHEHTPAMEWLEIATLAINAFNLCDPLARGQAFEVWYQRHA